MIFCRVSFGVVLSDLRSLGIVCRIACAVVVRTSTGDRMIEIYGMFHTPGICYMPPTGFLAMSFDTYAHFILSIFVFGAN